MSEIIHKVLDEKPANVIDYFEEFSRKIRTERFQLDEKLSGISHVDPDRLEKAKSIISIFQLLDEQRDREATFLSAQFEDERAENGSSAYDVVQMQSFWYLAGCGFPQRKACLLSCCMRMLTPLTKNCR